MLASDSLNIKTNLVFLSHEALRLLRVCCLLSTLSVSLQLHFHVVTADPLEFLLDRIVWAQGLLLPRGLPRGIPALHYFFKCIR
jgi:hypothetical protein